MTWEPIQTGVDRLEQFSKRSATDAVAELIWNALDAEADEVTVTLDTDGMADARELERLLRVEVRDTGRGMTAEMAKRSFLSFGDSWKKSLNGQTPHEKRPLHGRHGRGRFFAYALGNRARWHSVSRGQSGDLESVTILGDIARINGFEVEGPIPTDATSTGTVIEIDVADDRHTGALLEIGFPDAVCARLAPYLLGNPTVSVVVDGKKLDPADLIASRPDEIELSDVPGLSADSGLPRLAIIEWTPEMRSPVGLVLCSANGTALLELPHWVPSPTVKVTGYMKWDGFAKESAEMALITMQHNPLIERAKDHIAEYVGDRTRALRGEIVLQMKREGSYPYKGEPASVLEATERDVYEIVLVAARRGLARGSIDQRRMSARLLQLALQERPESLDTVLTEALNLSDDERAALVDLLRQTRLSAIVASAATVARRIDLLLALRHFLYTEESERFGEVKQLHPLVKDNLWLIDDSWQLTQSEASIRTLLAEVTKADDVIWESELAKADEETLRRVDLLLQRTDHGPGGFMQRLVVELKRPSVVAGVKELDQIKRYARTISKHAGVGKSKWSFWLIASELSPEIHDELNQEHREPGVAVQLTDYEVRVVSWADLLNRSDERYGFLKATLDLALNDDDAIARVRAIHGELVPSETAEAPGA